MYLKDGKSETEMLVYATPNYKQLTKKHKLKVKVIEKRGGKMKKLILKVTV